MPKKTLTAALTTLALTVASHAALPNTVTLRNFFGNGQDSLLFNRPVNVTPYPSEDSAFVVLQQSGQVLTVRWQAGKWQRIDSAVISGLRGGTSGGDEQGLLGFAFHPGFTQNRKYYLYYVTGSSDTARANHLVERTAGVSGRPATSDAQRTVLRLRDPYDNHNGGTIGFDKEGFLVAGLGDGGSGGDPQNRAQNKTELLGKFIRLDVDAADAFPDDSTRNYAIPSTNPFKDSASYRPEIWAVGVRNPWKWNFHPVTGDIWAGDVGQDAVEEISRVPKGGNLGWKIREGNSCFSPSSGCATTGFVRATLAVNQPLAQSITGGAFFTGSASSAYNGVYIYGDYVTDSVWAARIENDSLKEHARLGRVYNVVSFNRDSHGRVLVSSLSSTSSVTPNNGIVYVLESPDMAPADPVNVRRAPRANARPISIADLRRHPARYEIRGLDGREMPALVSGTAWVREKGSNAPPQLLSLVW